MHTKRTISITLGFIFIGLMLLTSIMTVMNDLEEMRWYQTNNPTTPRIIGGQKTTADKIKEALNK